MGSTVSHGALAGSSQQLSLASVGKTGFSQLGGANGLSQTVTQQNAVPACTGKADSVTRICCVMVGQKALQ